MATLTTNLFWGQGERDHELSVVDGHWPDDIAGSVFIVGPDKRRPGGHWFAEPGLIEKIHLRPGADGRIKVEHRLVDTPIDRLRRRLPFLFRKVAFAELSPFGVSNFANTNLAPIDDRLFVGYDAGRPLEVDPETLRFLTPVGANDEWMQAVPGLLEPLCAVAAHAAVDNGEGALWFVNYDLVAPPGTAKTTDLARWDLDGPVKRWRVDGMSEFDSIHDVKVTEHHLVFSDLPFVVEPETFRGRPRTRRIQEHSALWIVAKADLAATPPGGRVPATEVRLPMPIGHVYVDHEEVEGTIRLAAQHGPLGDLVLGITRESKDHQRGELIDPNYDGLFPLSVQPSVIGRHVIEPASGKVVESELAMDVDRVWGGVLPTTDTSSPIARRRQRQLWLGCAGFDPGLITEAWWSLYADATDGVVAPADLPTQPVPGSLARFDLEAMKVAEVWTYEDGAFPSPPTFVPRVGAVDADDGYVVVVVHLNGPKEVQVFDAGHIEAGPLASATASDFNPGLLLHSCWMPDRVGPRPTDYRIPMRRDLRGAVQAMPGVLRRLARMGRSMVKPSRSGS